MVVVDPAVVVVVVVADFIWCSCSRFCVPKNEPATFRDIFQKIPRIK